MDKQPSQPTAPPRASTHSGHHAAHPPKKEGPKPPLLPSDVINQKKVRIATHRDLNRLLLKLVLMIGVVWLLFSQVFSVYRVEGEGMYPRLRDGDLAIVYRLQKEFVIDDVVTYRINDGRYVGRVIATGGDTVDLNADGELVRNGNVQQEEIFFPTNAQDKPVKFPVSLHEFEVFVLGDNREQTKDSRDFGALDKAKVDGLVIAIIRIRGL